MKMRSTPAFCTLLSGILLLLCAAQNVWADSLSGTCSEGSTTYGCDSFFKVDVTGCSSGKDPTNNADYYSDRFFIVGSLSGTSSNVYNLSRTGQFREIQVTSGNQVSIGSSGCTDSDQITPPYDQDVSAVLVLQYCYWMAGSASYDFGGRSVTYTGTSTAGVATFGCTPFLKTVSIKSRAVSSSCKSVILKEKEMQWYVHACWVRNLALSRRSS